MDNLWIQAYIYSGLALMLGLIFYIIKSSIKRKKKERIEKKESFLKTLEEEIKKHKKE